ncbi:Hypothetical Protein FCC1311_062732 [Hondaea fermentalgiana]|uniref:Uncharacterized protein n=1 Tax=Hondaea fermentalgiana TaxID=2315210 RepID=A0A2R5GN64_9STRA|nr:Hypothetical Protein FCC1311_062732 [Hondaea fermentalgiana]|eukprot:GBG30053.1 Hypothetical Protein FCC1311_062732 [Hondaea fermentalgiana]
MLALALAVYTVATLTCAASAADWTTTAQNGLVLVVAPSDSIEATPDTAYWDLKDEQLVNVSDFFEANSGGLQTIDFEVPRVLLVSDDFETSDCGSSTQCPDLETIALTAAAEYNVSTTYDRLVVLVQGGCSCLSESVTAILSSVVEVGASDEASDLVDIVARGIAHSNGASQSSRNDPEYLTPFTIMGGEASVPEGHLSAAGKLAFDWLDPTANIATFARADHPECAPADGGSCLSSGSVWIESHDTGAAYATDKYYAARIFSGLSGAALWVEYRTAYRQDNDADAGAFLVWTPADLPVGSSGSATLLPRYGPAHALPYRMGSEAERTDYFVPLGGSFVYDLDATAVEVRVSEQEDDDGSSPLTGRIKIEVNMLDRTYERSYPYPTTEQEAESGGPVTVAGLMACGSGRWLSLSNDSMPDGFYLYRLSMSDPKDVTFEQLVCSAGSSFTDLATLYVYDAYPIQLMRQAARGADIDPAVGAFKTIEVTCDGSSHETEVALDNIYAQDTDRFRPMALDYYVLMHRPSALASSPLSRLWFEVSCTDRIVECRDNFYANRTGDCVQCPLGSKAVADSREETDCYQAFPSVTITWNTQADLDGTYTQITAAHGAAPVFVRSSPSVAYLLKDSESGTWGILTSAALASDQANPEIVELPVLSSEHPHPLAAGSQLESGSQVVVLSGSGTVDASDPYGNSFSQTYLGWSFHDYTPTAQDLGESSVATETHASLFLVAVSALLALRQN